MGLQATNAGIDFQQRVSAFMMIIMEFGIEFSKVLGIDHANEKIVKIDFESCESIDDLVLTLESGRNVYFQMKRTISLSDEVTSEFYKVCKQFVSQYKKNKTTDLAYILMTRSEASGTIVQKLRRVLDGIRLSKSLDIIETLNPDEKNVINKFLSNIRNIFKTDHHEDVSDEKLLTICMKTYIETLDIEGGEAFEKTIFLMLYDKLKIDPIVFWNGLIARAIEYGGNRRSLSVESLNDFFDEYKKHSIVQEVKPVTNIIAEQKNDFQEEDIRFDYVVCKPTEKTQSEFGIEEKTYFLIEMYRFLESERIEGRKYVSPNMLYMKNGMELVVLFRSSTQTRCEKFFESFECEPDSKLLFMPAKKGDVKITAAETMHKSLIVSSLDKIQNNICINCGKPITDKTAYMIEIDNEEVSGVAGMAHIECTRPIDRVLGECFLTISDEYARLNRFNINKWIELCKKGKTTWEALARSNFEEKVMVVNNFDVFEDGNYCVCNILEDGNKHYTTKRGKIERFGHSEAQKWRNLYRNNFRNAKEQGNPFGYTSETSSFCNYERYLVHFPNETFTECIDAKVEPYNQVIASIYNDSNTYYSPLIYFSIDGKPLILSNGVFPLISDPFKVTKCLDNWNKAGQTVEDYELCIIDNDSDFILKISSLISMRIRPVVDCLFLPSQKLVSGTPIFLEWEIEAEEKGVPIIEE